MLTKNNCSDYNNNLEYIAYLNKLLGLKANYYLEDDSESEIIRKFKMISETRSVYKRQIKRLQRGLSVLNGFMVTDSFVFKHRKKHPKNLMYYHIRLVLDHKKINFSYHNFLERRIKEK